MLFPRSTTKAVQDFTSALLLCLRTVLCGLQSSLRALRPRCDFFVFCTLHHTRRATAATRQKVQYGALIEKAPEKSKEA